MTTLVACLTAYRGFVLLFSFTPFWDDTGYFLGQIRCFNEHGGLYHTIYSQYGPFYSEFYYLVCGLLGVPITHDAIRFVVLVLWIVSSIAGAMLAFRLTGRIWIAILAQLLCFEVLYAFPGEAGHPISLIVVCLGILALCLTAGRGERLAWWQGVLTGGLLGALLMTKVNIGIFAVAGIGTAWVYCSPLDRAGRILCWASGFLFCLFPILLVRVGWPLQERLVLTALFICSLLGVLVSIRGQIWDWQTSFRYGLWILAGLALFCSISLSAVVITGSGWTELIDAHIREPMRLSTIHWWTPGISPAGLIKVIIGLLAAFAWRFFPPESPLLRRRVSFGLRLFFLGIVVFWLATSRNYFTTVLPFLWIAVLTPERNSSDTGSITGQFARLSLVLLAVGQTLGIYPAHTSENVAVYLGSLSFLLVCEGMFADLKTSDALQGFSWLPRIPAIAIGIGFAIVLTASFWRVIDEARSNYNRFSSLALPGAKILRINESLAARYRFLVQNLRDCRPSFLAVPGFNSLYDWSGREYPTCFTASMNFGLLSTTQQRAMVEVGRRCKPIACVFNREIIDFWTKGRYQPSGPLIDFVLTECRPIGRIENFELMVLGDSPSPRLTYCAILNREWQSDEPDGRISVSLPANFGTITRASLLDAASGNAIGNRMDLTISENFAGTAPLLKEGSQQLTFDISDPGALSPDGLDDVLVQLWDRGGHLVANVPFLRSPESRHVIRRWSSRPIFAPYNQGDHEKFNDSLYGSRFLNSLCGLYDLEW